MIRRLRNVVVDPVAAREAAALAAIHSGAFRRTWSSHDFSALLAQENVFALGVRVKPLIGVSRLAGFVLVRFAADEAEILTIAVAPGDRRRGYGRLLMEDVIRRLYREHVASLFLEVDRGNKAAVALYGKLGFQIVGRRAGYYTAQQDDDGTALVMRLQVR